MSSDFRILVVLPNNLGDVLMATPALEGRKKKYPRSHLTFLVEEGFEGSLVNNPFIDRIFLFDRKTIRNLLLKDNWKNALNILKETLGELNTHPFDLIINLSQHQYTSYLVSLVHAEVKYGQYFLSEGNHAIKDSWTQYLYTIPFARRFNSLHAVDIYRRIAQAMSHHGGYTISLSTKEKEKAQKYLTGIGIDLSSEKIIVMQPGAALASKRWPERHFIALGQLLAQSGWQIIISGAISETELALRVQRGIGKNCFSTAGDTDFRQAIANLSFAKGCITGDTALMHAAAALNVKTYSLFGATNPVETGPYGDGHFIFSGDCSQKPCFLNQCDTMECMNNINPETVFSCIQGCTLPLFNECTTYRTSLKKNEDYFFEPVNSNGFLYYSTEGASLTKRAFGEKVNLGTAQNDELTKCSLDSQKTVNIITEMEHLLSEYLNTKNKLLIKTFEKKKKDLLELPGIAQFWTALLNIRLNSIPLLNLIDGINMSIQACRTTKEQINFALSSTDNPMS